MKTASYKPKPCLRCSSVFKPNGARARYCDACHWFACEWCQERFEVCGTKVGGRFCSTACANLWQQSAEIVEERRRATLAMHGTSQVVACVVCGKEERRPKVRVDRAAVAYCSSACRRKAVALVCPVCSARFTRPPSDLRKVNYCSDDCRNAGVLMRRAAGEWDGQETGLEKAGRSILDGIGEPYTTQESINGRFVVDVLFAGRRLVAQWDGDFWHANPAVYPPLFLSVVQKNNVARDRKCNAYLAKCGYVVLRFWETDVHGRPEWVEGQIRRALANSERT